MKAIILRLLWLVAVLVMSNATVTGQSGLTMGYSHLSRLHVLVLPICACKP